jgi:serine/threonine protein kinase
MTHEWTEPRAGTPQPPTSRDPRPPTTRDVRPPTVRDGRSPTTRDNPTTGTRRDAPADTPDQPDPVSDLVLPDYLAREFDVAEEFNSGGEADVALIRRRRDGNLNVIKIYRRGITLPQGFVQQLATADPAHVLPVTRSTYTGWKTPRFIEVMDYLPQGSLESLLQRSGGTMTGLARDILIEMTDALDYIHNQLHIVHRDIKPANILIRSRNPLDLVLADLGIAAELAELRRSRRETTGGIKGTLVYQSPETLNMSDAGAARDWWALGMTLCEVLTGVHPFKDSRGNPLRDENMIRHAITMGSIDLAMVTDEHWNLLCRGLLTHDPDQRWAAPQVRAWLAGDSPPVAAHRPQQGFSDRAVRPYRFVDGTRFTDPAALASHMVVHWEEAVRVFTSEEDCATLRTWIREEVNDAHIDVNSLLPISGGDPARVDTRIIEFTTHYLGGQDLTFRGVRISARGLAERYVQSSERWEQDELLAALTPTVAAALADSQRNESAGPAGQSDEYYALASLSRFADRLDHTIDEARVQISRGAANRVEDVDVGATVRDGLPRCADRARGLARAALLSPGAAKGIRDEFGRIRARSPQWFVELCSAAASHPASGTAARPSSEADHDEIALKTLAVTLTDLAAIYDQAATTAVAQAERRRAVARAEEQRRQAEMLAQQQQSAQRARLLTRRDRDGRALLWAVGLCVTVLVPLGLGYFVMAKTPLLKPNPAVLTDDVRKFSDHFPAYYLAGVFLILIVLAVALLWPPLQGRPLWTGIGVVALIGAIMAATHASSSWEGAEAKAVDRLASTAFPFGKHYYSCGSSYFDLNFKNGDHQMWQNYLAKTTDLPGSSCNRIVVYEGWNQVGVFTLTGGDSFVANSWDNTNVSRGGLTLTDIFVNMKTAKGHQLRFSLDGAQRNDFALT